jgi:hypothetical protein
VSHAKIYILYSIYLCGATFYDLWEYTEAADRGAAHGFMPKASLNLEEIGGFIQSVFSDTHVG